MHKHTNTQKHKYTKTQRHTYKVFEIQVKKVWTKLVVLSPSLPPPAPIGHNYVHFIAISICSHSGGVFKNVIFQCRDVSTSSIASYPNQLLNQDN